VTAALSPLATLRPPLVSDGYSPFTAAYARLRRFDPPLADTSLRALRRAATF